MADLAVAFSPSPVSCSGYVASQRIIAAACPSSPEIPQQRPNVIVKRKPRRSSGRDVDAWKRKEKAQGNLLDLWNEGKIDL